MADVFIKLHLGGSRRQWRKYKRQRLNDGLPVAHIEKYKNFCAHLSVRLPKGAVITARQMRDLDDLTDDMDARQLRAFRVRQHCVVICPAYRLKESWLVRIGQEVCNILMS